MVRWLIFVLGALLLVPTGASAKPISMPYDEFALAVASAPGRVLVAEPDPFGVKAIVVRELRVSSRADRVVVEIPYEGDERPDVMLSANASGYLIAFAGVRERLILGGYDGSLRTLADCPPAPDAAPLRLAAGTTGFAVAEGRCGLPQIATVAPDGTVTPVASATPPPGDAAAPYGAGDGSEAVIGLAYAEPSIAVATPGFARVVDVTTGVERRVPRGLIGIEVALAVHPDGTLAFVNNVFSGVREGLFVWRPDAAAPALIDARADGAAVATAGGRLVYEADGGARVVGLGGGPSRALSMSGLGLVDLLGFDAERATFRSSSCHGDTRATVVDVTAPPAPGSVTGCPVRFVQHSVRFGRSGTARLTVRCRNGCRDTLTIIQRATRRHPCTGERRQDEDLCPSLATAELDLPSSRHARPVTVRLTDAGRRLRGRTLDSATVFVNNGALKRVGDVSRARL